jgi:hypothetical protein
MDDALCSCNEVADDSFPARQTLFNEDVVRSVWWHVLDGFPINSCPNSLVFGFSTGKINSHSHSHRKGTWWSTDGSWFQVSLYEKQREWEAVMVHLMLQVHPQHSTGMRMYTVYLIYPQLSQSIVYIHNIYICRLMSKGKLVYTQQIKARVHSASVRADALTISAIQVLLESNRINTRHDWRCYSKVYSILMYFVIYISSDLVGNVGLVEYTYYKQIHQP